MEEEKTGFPKFQFSVFSKNGRDSQYVIRSNEWGEFLKMKLNLEAYLDGQHSAAQPKTQTEKQVDESVEEAYGPSRAPSANDYPEGVKVCPTHPQQWLKERHKEGKIFWSHARQLEDGSWDYCSGRGWKSELK